MQGWDKQTWSKMLEKYDSLGAAMAAAKWLATSW